MGLSWHSEKKLKCPPVPPRGTTGSLPYHHTHPSLQNSDGHTETTPWNSTPLLHQFLCHSVGHQVHIWWLHHKVQLCFAPRGKPSKSRASLRHWETFCHSTERTASERFLQQTPLITQENTIACHSLLAEGFSRAPLWTWVSPGGPRQGQVCRKSHGTEQDCYFETLPVAARCRLPLLPRWAAPSAQGMMCRETESNMLHSFLCWGGK